MIIDTSDLKHFFDIRGEVKVPILRPGMALKKSIKITPLNEEGLFPVKIKITGSGATNEKQYTIKVGGTEIY